jgi:outer membrane immunogenic protein
MEILLPGTKILLARGLKLWQIRCSRGEPTMLNSLSRRTLYTLGAALTAIILTTTNLHAGLFNIPNEAADWNGPYVGFSAGAVWGNFNISNYTTLVDLDRQWNALPPVTHFTENDGLFPFPADGHSSSDANGYGGIELGYNKQWGMFVAGFNFGFSGTQIDDSSQNRQFQTNTVSLDTGQGGAVDTDFHSWRQVEQVWSGSAGGQIGVAWRRFLFYANGGSAFAQVDARELDRAATNFSGLPTASGVVDKQLTETNNILTGWYAGGGLQFAFSDAVTAGIEYRHADYGDRKYKFNEHKAIFPGATTFSEDTNAVVFKVSILLGHLGEKKAPEPGLSKK